MIDLILKDPALVWVEPMTEAAVRAAVRSNANAAHGDLSVNYRYLAERLSIGAEECCGLLQALFGGSVFVERTEIASVFVNLFLNRAKFADRFFAKYRSESYGGGFCEGKTAIVEHTSATPIAPPHIGRIHNTVIGDAIVRLLRFGGADVSAHYFVNDMAKQIAITVTACGGADGLSFENMLKAFRDASEKLKTDVGLEARVRERLDLLEQGDADTVEEFRRVVTECIEGHKRIFSEMQIYFDSFDHESKYITDGSAEAMIARLKSMGRIRESGGAVSVVLDGGKDGEDVLFPLTRENGTSLYSIRDICYSIEKARYGADINLVVLGEEQIPHYAKVSEVLALLGYKNAECVSYAHLDSSVTVYSTKQGRGMITEDVAREVAAALAEGYGHRMNGDELLKMAYGTVKFELLRCDNRHNIAFDPVKLCGDVGDSCRSVIYAAVRAGSLLDKYGRMGGGVQPSGFQLLCSDEGAWELFKECCRFRAVLDGTVKSGYQFSKLALYLITLGKKFSSFYERVRLLDGECDDVCHGGMALVGLVREVLKNGLDILGISVPNEM